MTDRQTQLDESCDPWESRYRALEEAAVKLRDERDELRVDLEAVRDYFKSTWNIDQVIASHRKRKGW